MKLREGSLNERPAPAASTPVGKPDKGRRRTIAKPRVPSGDAAVHIAALEVEIATLNSRLAAFTSPTRTKAQSAKLRTLHAQVKKQAETIAEWEQNFQERAEDAKYERTKVEQSLQTRIRALEEDCEWKEVKIKELEWELETVRGKVKDMESLELTNQDLDRRVEVLTGLLGQSPTRLDFPSVIWTPGSSDPTKRTPRPTSLRLPRLYTYPASVRHSASLADAISWHSRNIGSMSSLSISETPEDELRSPFDKQPTSILSEPLSRPVSMLSAPDNADSSQPATFLSSRPTSLISNYSFGASWGLPAANGSSERSQSAGRARKMRRFPSGRCSLKPLILPVAAAVGPSLPASAPATSSHTTPSGDVSRCSRHSIDPTTAFLSRPIDDSSPFTTPTQRPRRRSASLARRQTLDALEGRSQHAVYANEENDESARRHAADNADNNHGNVSCTPSPCVFRTQRRSLEMELEQAEEAEKAFLERGPPATSTSGVLDPHTMQRALGPPPLANDADTPLPPQYPHDDRLRLRRVVSNSSDTPRPPKTTRPPVPSPTTPLPAPPTPVPGTRPLLSRLTGLVRTTTPPPLLLAKRIITNAYQSSSGSGTGGLGWWLLGLLLGFRHRKQNGKGADVRVVEDEATNRPRNRAGSFDWQPYSAEASKARRAQALWRDLRYRVGESAVGEVGVEADARGRGRGRGRDGAGGTNGAAQTSEQRHPHVDADSAAAAREADPSEHADADADAAIVRPYRCGACVEPSSRRTFRLWLRFSAAVLLAFRVALVQGPGALLEDRTQPDALPVSLAMPPRLSDPRGSGGGAGRVEREEGERSVRDSQETMVGSLRAGGEGGGGFCSVGGSGERDEIGKEIGTGDGILDEGSWGWEVTFAEPLGPGDFEGVGL